MNGLYCAIDCTVFIWDEMSDVESVAISFNNSLIAVNLTVSPGFGANVCSRKLHRKINRGFFMGLINWGRSWKRKTFDPEEPKVYWVAEARLELTTFGLWAQRATTAPLRDIVAIISWLRVQRYILHSKLPNIFKKYFQFVCVHPSLSGSEALLSSNLTLEVLDRIKTEWFI